MGETAPSPPKTYKGVGTKSQSACVAWKAMKNLANCKNFATLWRERSVRFRAIEVEGVLGEYNLYERKVTLYPLMIELVAKDLASALGRQPESVHDDFYTITEMHETAHATTHLGMNADGTLWEHTEQGEHRNCMRHWRSFTPSNSFNHCKRVT